MKTFITYLVSFQTVVLIICTPLFIKVAHVITHKLQLTNKIEVFYLGCMLFVAEGIISVIRLIYHSYFWQRQFNSQMSVIIIFKTLILFIFILKNTKSKILLKTVFVTELLATFVAILLSTIMLKRLYKSKNLAPKKISRKKTAREFALHSGIMWINNNIKSLSERNFMMLFFTHLLGPLQANLFKLANDGALLFQRIVVKTIGTTDTSLLSYATITPQSNKKKIMQDAFATLLIKIASLCIPLLGVLFFISFNFNHLFKSRFVFNIFFIITICYLFEHMLSPYERLLEVKRQYLLLFISYLPYMATIGSLLLFKNTKFMGLLGIIVTVHMARLIIYTCALYFAKTRYKARFPYKPIAKIACITILITSIASIIVQIISFL